MILDGYLQLMLIALPVLSLIVALSLVFVFARRWHWGQFILFEPTAHRDNSIDHPKPSALTITS